MKLSSPMPLHMVSGCPGKRAPAVCLRRNESSRLRRAPFNEGGSWWMGFRLVSQDKTNRLADRAFRYGRSGWSLIPRYRAALLNDRLV